MIGKTLGHYQVTAKLGEGGTGEVYRARDEHLDRDVALKVLPPGMLGDEAARRRFRREAEALSRLNHAHIATVHDFDSSDGIDFLVMEYMPGQTLSQRIAGRPLPEKEIATLGGDVAAALEEAHEHGVVHRNLKPANIIVSPQGPGEGAGLRAGAVVGHRRRPRANDDTVGERVRGDAAVHGAGAGAG